MLRLRQLKISSLIICVCVCVAYLLIGQMPVYSQEGPSSEGLFRPALAQVSAAALTQQATVRARLVETNFAEFGTTSATSAATAQDRAAISKNLSLNLFDDITLEAELELIEPRMMAVDGFVWIGRIRGMPTSAVAITAGASQINAIINIGLSAFEVTYVGNGQHLIRQIDTSELGDCLGGLIAPATTAIPTTPTDEPDSVTPPTAVDDDSMIDVMLVFANSAYEAIGNTDAAMINTANSAIALANASFINSQMTPLPRFRLVDVYHTNYAENADIEVDLNRVTTTSDGFIDEVHARRNSVRADLVSLIVNVPGSPACGVAWMLTSGETVASFEGKAFSVVQQACFSNFSLTHELAHNMGSQHNIEDADGELPLYAYSYGYRDPGYFRTIMAYDCDPSCAPRINYWSNVTITDPVSGRPMGNANADNRQSLLNAQVIVANFRVGNCSEEGERVRRASLGVGCQEANDASTYAVISADGRYLAFNSAASNLVGGDTNGVADVFVRDLQTNQTIRVSVAVDGTQGNGISSYPAISATGRYVAFLSEASNLVSDDSNGYADIFLHDMQTGETKRANVNSLGVQANGTSSAYIAVSPDGRYVAFNSEASNLVLLDTNSYRDVFVHDFETGQTKRVSVSSSGAQTDRVSGALAMSSDGRYIAFESNATSLVDGDTNFSTDIFFHDTQTGITKRISVASDGSQANGSSGGGYHMLSISADGRYVVFVSAASNLVSGDSNDKSDIFLHDTVMATTERLIVAADGGQSNGDSAFPQLTADARYLVFESFASNLVADDSNGQSDIFVYDRQLLRTSRVSLTSSGGQGNARSTLPSISNDAKYVAFQSSGNNFVAGDNNFVVDVFVVNTANMLLVRPDTIGIYRPSTNTFYLRNSNSTGFSDINVSLASLGMDPNEYRDVPVVGDWNGDGIDTVGFYRRGRVSDNAGAGLFVLSDSNSSPQADYSFVLGNPSDTPLVGDWNGDSRDTVGVFRPSNGLIYIKNNLTTGFADYTMVLGNPGDAGIAGDWDNDGRDSPGVYRPGVAPQFYLTNQVCNCVVASDYNVTFGDPGDQPFTGDWNGDGRTGVGVYRTSNGITYLRNDPTTTGFSDFNFVYGVNGDYAFGGVWAAATPPAQIEIAPTFQP